MASVRGPSSKKNSVHVISGPFETAISKEASSSSPPPVEGLIGQRRPHLAVSQSSRRSVYEGILLKRCRLSWRERIVEIIRDSAELTGVKTSYQILIFDPRKRTLKDRIPMEDVVTIRSSCDCYFQIFLSNGKILQFKAENMDSQAYWMALIKVGLGRGSIFHVRVHTAQKGLEHALLYSIGVNRPAHRVGQLDRVLVLASPINDINIHAWDLNRVKHFMQLDIGVQMELCSHCVTSSLQGTSITFIMDKMFHEECINFLCQEARIGNQPASENSLMVYPLNHTCPRGSESTSSPPPYSKAVEAEAVDTSVEKPPHRTVSSNNIYTSQSDSHTHIVTSTTSSNTGEPNGSIVQQTTTVDTFQPTIPAGIHGNDPIPPRNITRQNFESAMPAVAHPYMNFQPQIFQNAGSSKFESPYQISSRIIITNSGEVQYERNILGNKPQHHGGFHFKSSLPLPPRSFSQTPDPSLSTADDAPRVITPIYPTIRSPTRTSSLPVSHPRREEQRANKKLEKRASEVSDSDYVFIPDVVHDPSRVPLPQVSHHHGNAPPPSETNPECSNNNIYDPSLANLGVQYPFYVNYNRSNKGLNVHATIVEGMNPPSTQGMSNTTSHPPSYNSQEEQDYVEGSNIQILEEEPSINLPPSTQTPQIPSTQTPRISSPPTPRVQVLPHQLPQDQVKEERTEVESLSGSYEDIVSFSQQLSIRHPLHNGTGSIVPNIEVQNNPHVSIPVPSSHDTVLIPFQPPPPPSSSVHQRPTSPNKPQAKPRRKKLLSESDFPRTDFHSMPSASEKSQTIPKASTPSSNTHSILGPVIYDSTSSLGFAPARLGANSDLILTNFEPNSPSSQCVHSHAPDFAGNDCWSSSSSVTVDSSLPPTTSSLPVTTTTHRHLLTNPPLTPPIPRPRPSFYSRGTVGGVVGQRTEDDSAVGVTRRRGSSSASHKQNTLSTFIAVTDL